MSKLIAAAVALAVFLVLDILWLGLWAASFFQAQLGPLLRPTPDLLAAAVFYLVYGFGMAVLVLEPALAKGSARTAGLLGAALGLVAYSTFELTNLAIVAGWSLPVVLVDIGWGTLATSLACSAGFAAARRWAAAA